MRFLRRLIYVLLTVVILGWGIGWFVGQRILEKQVLPNLRHVAADSYALRAQDYRVTGFPFSYRISPLDAQVIDQGSGQTLITMDDQLAFQLSLPGMLWSYVTNRQVSASVDFRGTYGLSDDISVSLDRAKFTLTLAQLAPLKDRPEASFGGIGFDIRGLTIHARDQVLATLDQAQFDMSLLTNGQGYDYRVDLSGLRSEIPLSETIPNHLARLSLRAESHPAFNSDLFYLLTDLQAGDPLAALGLHSLTISQLMASNPGLFISQGLIDLGSAQFEFSADLPLKIRLSSASGNIELDAQISGQGLESLLLALTQDPLAQGSDLGLIANDILSAVRLYGLDLESGETTHRIEAVLLSFGSAGPALLPGGFRIDGQQIVEP